jgi:hypothetical protein
MYTFKAYTPNREKSSPVRLDNCDNQKNEVGFGIAASGMIKISATDRERLHRAAAPGGIAQGQERIRGNALGAGNTCSASLRIRRAMPTATARLRTTLTWTIEQVTKHSYSFDSVSTRLGLT